MYSKKIALALAFLGSITGQICAMAPGTQPKRFCLWYRTNALNQKEFLLKKVGNDPQYGSSYMLGYNEGMHPDAKLLSQNAQSHIYVQPYADATQTAITFTNNSINQPDKFYWVTADKLLKALKDANQENKNGFVTVNGTENKEVHAELIKQLRSNPAIVNELIGVYQPLQPVNNNPQILPNNNTQNAIPVQNAQMMAQFIQMQMMAALQAMSVQNNNTAQQVSSSSAAPASVSAPVAQINTTSTTTSSSNQPSANVQSSLNTAQTAQSSTSNFNAKRFYLFYKKENGQYYFLLKKVGTENVYGASYMLTTNEALNPESQLLIQDPQFLIYAQEFDFPIFDQPNGKYYWVKAVHLLQALNNADQQGKNGGIPMDQNTGLHGIAAQDVLIKQLRANPIFVNKFIGTYQPVQNQNITATNNNNATTTTTTTTTTTANNNNVQPVQSVQQANSVTTLTDQEKAYVAMESTKWTDNEKQAFRIKNKEILDKIRQTLVSKHKQDPDDYKNWLEGADDKAYSLLKLIFNTNGSPFNVTSGSVVHKVFKTFDSFVQVVLIELKYVQVQKEKKSSSTNTNNSSNAQEEQCVACYDAVPNAIAWKCDHKLCKLCCENILAGKSGYTNPYGIFKANIECPICKCKEKYPEIQIVG